MEPAIDYLSLMKKMTDVVAHDIRNPLNNILLSTAQFKMEALPDKEDTAFYIDIIERNCDRIHTLLSEITSVLHQQGLNPGTFDLTEVLAELLEEQKERIALRGINLETSLKDVVVAHFDRDKVKAAFLCLLDNALEASEKGGTVKISALSDDTYAYIAIADQGAGIPETVMPFIYAPFFTTRQRNKGLGLSIVKNVLDAHGGHAVIESTAQGTTFTVHLPLKAQEQASS